MLARLLYAAVALCLLGTWPEHAARRPAPSADAAPPLAASRAGAPARVGPAPAEFAIPATRR